MSKEFYEYAGDVEYAAWRRGYNPDCVDRDRLRDQFYDGLSVDEAAEQHVSRLRNAGGIELFYYSE